MVLIVNVFARPGTTRSQMTPTAQADEDPLEHLVLTCDDALDLEHGAPDHVAVGAFLQGFQMRVVRHPDSSSLVV